MLEDITMMHLTYLECIVLHFKTQWLFILKICIEQLNCIFIINQQQGKVSIFKKEKVMGPQMENSIYSFKDFV